jgi:hypothetical protein
VIANTYLAELAPEVEHAADDGLLIVFFDSTAPPAPLRLSDPIIVGFGVARGEWQLVLIDSDTERGFYLRDELQPGIGYADAAWYLEFGS